ncbi:MAG: hypothetical protein VB961_05140 [Dehalococcoidia bacterium]
MATTQISRCGRVVGHVQRSAAMLTRQGSYVGGVASVAPAASEYKVSHVAYHLRGELRADYIIRKP